MSGISKRIVRPLCIALLLFAALAIVFVDFSFLSGDPGCAHLSNWLANHTIRAQTYDEICKYPMRMRPALFNALSPEAKAEFRQTHIWRYVALHPELSSIQRETLLKEIALLMLRFKPNGSNSVFSFHSG